MPFRGERRVADAVMGGEVPFSEVKAPLFLKLGRPIVDSTPCHMHLAFKHARLK